jgi:hypothetical protein
MQPITLFNAAIFEEQVIKGLHPLERFTPRLSQTPLLFYAALTANNDFLR